jgi:hypothetical protein
MATPRRRGDQETMNQIAGTPARLGTHPNTDEPRLARERSHDEIARRAYELFEARGGEPGHELEDWFQAEREL